MEMWVEPASSADFLRRSRIGEFSNNLMYCRVTHYPQTLPPPTAVDIGLSASGEVLSARLRTGDPATPFGLCVAWAFAQSGSNPEPHTEPLRLRVTVSYW